MISRLTDPYDKKNQNLSLKYFLESENITNKKELYTIYEKIIEFRNKIVRGRNKIISHNDIEALLSQSTYAQFDIGEDLECIDNIQEFLNVVSKELKGEIFGDIVPTCSGDAYDLMKIIRYGNCVKKKWNDENTKEEVKDIIIECLR